MCTVSLWCTAKFIHRFGKQNHLRWAMALWWLKPCTTWDGQNVKTLQKSMRYATSKLVQDFSHQQYHWPYSSPRHAKSSKSFLKGYFFGSIFRGVPGDTSNQLRIWSSKNPPVFWGTNHNPCWLLGWWYSSPEGWQKTSKNQRVIWSFPGESWICGIKNLGQGPIQHGYTWMEVTF